jgi:hypothetical protein
VIENGVYVSDEVMGHLRACSQTLGVPLPV